MNELGSVSLIFDAEIPCEFFDVISFNQILGPERQSEYDEFMVSVC